ncbi:MAG: bifunctional UDP-3-O-[3-hydroxymyristoyl] N-acetylglucosamine deacetylase/3-hydroxyacyl-ACP dehydratase [Candidatus Eisenbacteria sp.]|nr:bifunctional UDP-3-O-[3-hydroxymyristoyl] N-acetylglucosamine deacetylase/3-hydroxyacyl-ACP dehydratase [Candidatus Eisenbacteria bacterium]
MSPSQRTIAEAVSFTGRGLHSGEESTLTFKPAPVNHGVKFVRIDLPGKPVIQADIRNTPSSKDSIRRTTLQVGDAQVSTVEHVLAALAGLGIDNVLIEIDSLEPAEPDGSSQPFVDVLKRAGTVKQNAPKRYFRVTHPISFHKNGVELMALPHDGFRISFTLEYDHPVVGTQYASFDIDEKTFESEIAPARTFSLIEEVEELRKTGLIKGGSLLNAVVVSDEQILNEEPLRFKNEFVRHKILDLLGDLSLLGMPILGHIISVKSGHASNVRLVRKMREAADLASRHPIPSVRPKASTSWDIRAIQEIMPHRYPFLLVDRILELVEGERVVGIKNVTVNEPFFVGHFPGHPIMPAVLIVEAMAQVGGVLLLSTVENPQERLVYFMGIDKARFRKPVIPGDQLRFELNLLKLRSRTCKMKGRAFVDGELVAEAELLSMIVKR